MMMSYSDLDSNAKTQLAAAMNLNLKLLAVTNLWIGSDGIKLFWEPVNTELLYI